MTEGYSLSDVAAVTGRNNGWGNGMCGMEWLFALLLLPSITNGGLFGANVRGEVVTESAMCNSNNFTALQNQVGRMSDQQAAIARQTDNAICNLGYETLRNFNSLEQQLASCCCGIEKLLLENKYQAAQNTAEINANTTAQIQKVLDAICGNRMADMQNQINQLQLNSALCGIVRYPTQTTYGAGFNPFFGGFGCGCNSGCCGNGNI